VIFSSQLRLKGQPFRDGAQYGRLHFLPCGQAWLKHNSNMTINDLLRIRSLDAVLKGGGVLDILTMEVV